MYVGSGSGFGCSSVCTVPVESSWDGSWDEDPRGWFDMRGPVFGCSAQTAQLGGDKEAQAEIAQAVVGAGSTVGSWQGPICWRGEPTVSPHHNHGGSCCGPTCSSKPPTAHPDSRFNDAIVSPLRAQSSRPSSTSLKQDYTAQNLSYFRDQGTRAWRSLQYGARAEPGVHPLTNSTPNLATASQHRGQTPPVYEIPGPCRPQSVWLTGRLLPSEWSVAAAKRGSPIRLCTEPGSPWTCCPRYRSSTSAAALSRVVAAK